jgi:signal transduction histidine kinase
MAKVLRPGLRSADAGGTRPEPAGDVLLRGEPTLFDRLPELGTADSPLGVARLSAAIAVPMYPVLREPLLLVLYGDAPFGPEDMRFLALLSAHAAVCLDNVAMTRRLTAYSERLEKEVRERTRQLETANDELREVDGMKDRFLSSVSHEMKTPLTGIISGAELLATLTPDGDERREFVGMIGEQGQKLASLVDRILRFHALRRRSADGARDPIDPLALIASQLREIGPAAQSRKISVTTELPGRLPQVGGDPESLGLALREILANAVKFSPEGSQILVAAWEEAPTPTPDGSGAARSWRAGGGISGDAERAGSMIVISVADSGPGIPPDQHARIFERFEQLGNILTSKPEGLGLGLPIAREIAVRHGGDLRVESEPGVGSQFHLRLPVADARALEGLGIKVGARR